LGYFGGDEDMKPVSKSSVLMGAAAVMLGTAVAFSSVGLVSGASQIRPDKGKKACNTYNYCLQENNAGYGGAIEAEASGAAAIYASDDANSAIEGLSANGNGIVGVTQGEGVAVVGDTQSDDGLALLGEGANGFFYVESNGDGYFSGEVTAAGGYATVIRGQGGARVGAGDTLAPRTTIEDTGTARLTGGVGVVRLASDFAQTLDLRQGYQVFLTPDGDTRGLYVAQKYAAGFVVRENERGRSSVDFDYRIVAHPVGVSEQRFPPVKEPRVPRHRVRH
jgi:hypothetical protein